MTRIAPVLLALVLASACGSDGSTPTPPAMEEARVEYPTAFEVHTQLAAATCSPNPGVCHNSAEYPDLQTVSRLLDQVGAPCNVRHPVPEEGWDPCEGLGDFLTVGEAKAEIGWLEKLGEGEWKVVLREPMVPTPEAGVRILGPEEELIFEAPEHWTVAMETPESSGAPEITITLDLEPRDLAVAQAVLESVRGGDPNRNGIFGASDPSVESASIIWPGDRERSYLWRRLLGDVPGSRMPLANDPLTEAQFFALGCWIETLDPEAEPDLNAPIDYGVCTLTDVPQFD
jgi:hypothetical protein